MSAQSSRFSENSLLIHSFVLLLLISTLSVKMVAGSCSSHQIECSSNGRCVPSAWACDGEDDCGDGSDEKIDICPGKTTCSATEFQCRNGTCIPQKWQCDGEVDCVIDGSDEDSTTCSAKNCTEDQFACKGRPGECISLSWVCDFNRDCSDGSDEEGCNATCTAEEFTCSNGNCIQKHWICDGEDDCQDGSDEGEHCPSVLTTCPESNFRCQDGSCIQADFKCDGAFDCHDKSDEIDCPATSANVTSACREDHFACANGIECINQHWYCDGDTDCPDGSDERDCVPITCRPDQFRCADGQCIPGHLQCSGTAECNDTSDETDCGVNDIATSSKPDEKRKSAGCLPAEFDCGSGHCIDAKLLCNGQNDCGQWQDEPKDRCGVDECGSNKGGCSQICVDDPIGFHCQCRAGFKLEGNSTCFDIDECEEVGVCSHICINEKGSFKCQCRDGYSRDPHDRTRCKANEGHAALLFTHKTDIRRFSLDRHDLTAIVNHTRSSTALDFHFKTGMIFWSDVNDERIYKAPIDEGDVVSVVIQGDVVNADGLAVDWIYNHLFWTDRSKNTIEVSDFDGRLRKVLVTERLKEPRSIAVDPLEGWMYWSDWGATPQIERSGMDGSHRQVLVDTHLKWPNGITLDYEEKRLYWADAKLNTIASCRFDGSERRVVLSSRETVGHPFSVSVFEDWIYWSDWHHKSIMKANKFNGKAPAAITSRNSSGDPMTVHVYHPYRQPEGPNHCLPLNGRCSHLCLPAPQINSRSPKISCACPQGFTLQLDGLNCVEADSIIGPSQTNTSGELNVTNQPNGTGIATEDADSKKVSGDLVEDGDNGTVAAIVIGIVTIVVLLVALAAFFIYRQFVHRNATSMNFDNPVYRKTTEEKCALQKNQLSASRTYPAAPGEETMEPLTSPGTSEYV